MSGSCRVFSRDGEVRATTAKVSHTRQIHARVSTVVNGVQV